MGFNLVAVLGAIAAAAGSLAWAGAATASNVAAGAATANAVTASGLAPLPASDYGVRSVCPSPVPGYSECLALQLVPDTAQARAHRHPLGRVGSRAIRDASAAEGSFGLRPADLHAIYDLPDTGSSVQTIALIDAFNDPNAQQDLNTYDREFGLPECTEADKCFRKVNQRGEAGDLPIPSSDQELSDLEAGSASEQELGELARGWILEMSLDMETARATCQSCHIVLVEAESPSDTALETAERTASRLGVGEISNSWGGPELGSGAEVQETPQLDDESAFNDPGTVITAAAGDAGYDNWRLPQAAGYADYPASSPHVVAVGGTRLNVGPGDTWSGETVWSDYYGTTAGGCSAVFTAPLWQQNLSDWSTIGCGAKRAVSDISADADPYTGLAVYDSSATCEFTSAPHWCTVGGTSLSAPLIAGAFALAGGAEGVAYPAQTLYERAASDPGALHDVVSGSNGECLYYNRNTLLLSCSPSEEADASCSGRYVCLARTGYDGPTGLGTPDGLGAFEPSGSSTTTTTTTTTTSHTTTTTSTTTTTTSHTTTTTSTTTTTTTTTTSTTPSAENTGTTTTTTSAGSQTSGEPGPTGVSGASIASAPATPVMSDLSLTHDAVIALSGRRPSISTVAFSFTLSERAHVHFALSRRVNSHGRGRWQPLGDSVTLVAAEGRDHDHLTARGKLASGLYLLSATPTGGVARSITLRVG